MSITIRDLEQYASLKKEVEELQSRYARLCEKPAREFPTVVHGSNPRFPYEPRAYKVVGVVSNEKRIAALRRVIERRKRKLLDQLLVIEEFISTVNDSRIRRIIELHYIEGRTWAATAKRVYGFPGESTARMHLQRFFERF